jgi:ABC-2 type transport system permease protein
MSGNQAFEMVSESGWRRGFNNFLSMEMAKWWKTRRWLSQSLIWVLAIDLLLFVLIVVERSNPEGMPAADLVVLYSIFSGLALAIGVAIIMQGAIVGEKRDGTAAWVLSMPITRAAFILSKLVANFLGIVVTGIVIPGVIAYLAISLVAGLSISVLNFLAGMGILCLHVLFWLTVTLILGTLFDSRGPVIGIPLGLILGFQIITGLLPWVAYVIPYQLAFPMGEEEISAISMSVILGQQPQTWLPVFTAILLVVVLILLGVWRFNREDF